MDLRNIFFEIEYNFFKNQIKINYFNINNKEDLINQETQSILDEFNRDDSDGIKNWIDFKKITNRLLESQSG